MRKIFYFIFLLIVSISYSQKDLEKLEFKELSDRFYESNDFKYAQALLNKAKNINDNLQIAKGYYAHAYYYQKKEPIKALNFYDKAYQYSKDLNKPNFFYSIFSSKAYIYFNLDNVQEAIDNTLIAQKYAEISKNKDSYYGTKQFIAVIKSEKLGEISESLKLTNECLHYFTKNIKNNEGMYLNLLFSKADAFKALHENDSSSYYNKLGYKKSLEFKDINWKMLFTLNEGANLIDQKKFNNALDSINKSEKYLVTTDDYGNILACYYYKGKCYKGQNNQKEAVRHFLKVDSMYKVKGFITPEFMEGYPYLINYYKKKGDKNNQIKFLETYQKLETEFKEKYQGAYKKIKEQYEIPNLVREKDKKINFFTVLSYIAIGIGFFGIAFGFWQYYINKRNKARFIKIIEESLKWQKYPLLLENGEVIDVEHEEIEDIKIKQKKVIEKKSTEINQEIIIKILSDLNQFEKNKGFLEKSITSQTLAENLNTNSKYITNIINDYKNQKVNDYINDLRIEYAVLMLQKDKKIRRYNLDSLADEFGFNNVKSFNASFEKKTGIKPSFFIKNLNEEKN